MRALTYRKSLRTITLIFFLCFAMVACTDERNIRTKLLKETPIGTEFINVVLFCEKNNLECNKSEKAGYLNQKTKEVIGVKSIWTTYRERKTGRFFITSFAVYWGFDKNGKLVDVWVWKVIDGP